MLGRGFDTMTVPALKLDGRRVQGSREISRALDELAPQPPLFPADPQWRRSVQEAEEWGEALQDATRRLVLCAARRDPHAFHSVYRHANPIMRPVQHVSRRLVTRLAAAGHRATDLAGERDVAALPARLDQVDAWIAQGVLDGAELNAADFQIAPNLALLLRFEDLAPFIEGRPAAGLAQRLAPDFPGRSRGPAVRVAGPAARARRDGGRLRSERSARAAAGDDRRRRRLRPGRRCARTADRCPHGAMDADGRRLHLDVALEVEGEAIRGTVSDGVVAPREFSGWLELMSAFEIARSNARDRVRAC